jgi:hypothetical protein
MGLNNIASARILRITVALGLYICMAESQSLFGHGNGPAPERTVDREHEGRRFDLPRISPPQVSVPYATGTIPFYRVNQFSTTEPQNEPSVRISTKDPNLVVAAYRDFRLGSNPAIRNVGIANSTDGGVTWSERLFSYSNHDRYSDPGVAVDTAGNFYVVALSYSIDDPSNIGNALSLMKSTDGGANWFSIAPAIEGVPDVFEDREMIIADDSPTSPYSGHVYVSWTRFPGAGSTRIYCARSTDGGQSFEPPRLVSDGGNVQHSMPTTGPDGELYVTWADAGSIFVDVSTDGGVTFGMDRIISTPETPPLFSGRLQSSSGVELQVSGYPSLAVDKGGGQLRGTVYAVWMTRSSGDCDIICSKSTDRGKTWQPPVRVNDDPTGNGSDQFFSWVAVDERGEINIVSLDRRNDPANMLCDAYLAHSTDGGSTFTNTRITTESFDPAINYNADTRFGDYMGIDARLGRVVPVFTASISGNQDVYVAPVDRLPTYVRPGMTNGKPWAAVLDQNYPNPFNPVTVIGFSIEQPTEVHLGVFDLLGRKVLTLAEGLYSPGGYTVRFLGRAGDGQDLPSGTYFYALRTSVGTEIRRMILLR